MEKNKKTPKTIKEYVEDYEGPGLQHMLKIWEIIKKTAPDLKEKISWGMPTFYLNKNVVHFAHNKNHLGFYPGAEAVIEFEPELSEYVHSKGTIQFPYSKELPVDLIVKIVEYNYKKDKELSK